MDILVIAPHPDDEIIGVGGTIIKSINNGNNVHVCIVTRGVEPLFSEEAVKRTQEEAKTCHTSIGVKNTFFLDFPSVTLNEQHRYLINERIVEILKMVRPEEVYIPHVGDMQLDHRIVAESSMVALRPKYDFSPKRIYAYETLSETGWNIPNVQNEFIPNSYVDISDVLERKKNALCYFASQLASFPNARSLEAVEALAKYRGAVMNLKAAEAFMTIRELR